MRRTFQINQEWDIVAVRSEIRKAARQFGFDLLEQARIVQSVSELARNVVCHADKGLVQIDTLREKERVGLRFIVKDMGPGIADLEQVMKKMQTSTSVDSSGLQQVQKLMDDFTIRATEGKGTYVEVVKWLNVTSE